MVAVTLSGKMLPCQRKSCLTVLLRRCCRCCREAQLERLGKTQGKTQGKGDAGETGPPRGAGERDRRSASIITSGAQKGPQTCFPPDSRPYFCRDFLRGGVQAISAVIMAKRAGRKGSGGR